jgi:hypothetical protein
MSNGLPRPVVLNLFWAATPLKFKKFWRHTSLSHLIILQWEPLNVIMMRRNETDCIKNNKKPLKKNHKAEATDPFNMSAAIH